MSGRHNHRQQHRSQRPPYRQGPNASYGDDRDYSRPGGRYNRYDSPPRREQSDEHEFHRDHGNYNSKYSRSDSRSRDYRPHPSNARRHDVDGYDSYQDSGQGQRHRSHYQDHQSRYPPSHEELYEYEPNRGLDTSYPAIPPPSLPQHPIPVSDWSHNPMMFLEEHQFNVYHLMRNGFVPHGELAQPGDATSTGDRQRQRQVHGGGGGGGDGDHQHQYQQPGKRRADITPEDECQAIHPLPLWLAQVLGQSTTNCASASPYAMISPPESLVSINTAGYNPVPLAITCLESLQEQHESAIELHYANITPTGPTVEAMGEPTTDSTGDGPALSAEHQSPETLPASYTAYWDCSIPEEDMAPAFFDIPMVDSTAATADTGDMDVPEPLEFYSSYPPSQGINSLLMHTRGPGTIGRNQGITTPSYNNHLFENQLYIGGGAYGEVYKAVAPRSMVPPVFTPLPAEYLPSSGSASSGQIHSSHGHPQGNVPVSSHPDIPSSYPQQKGAQSDRLLEKMTDQLPPTKQDTPQPFQQSIPPVEPQPQVQPQPTSTPHLPLTLVAVKTITHSPDKPFINISTIREANGPITSKTTYPLYITFSFPPPHHITHPCSSHNHTTPAGQQKGKFPYHSLQPYTTPTAGVANTDESHASTAYNVQSLLLGQHQQNIKQQITYYNHHEELSAYQINHVELQKSYIPSIDVHPPSTLTPKDASHRRHPFQPSTAFLHSSWKCPTFSDTYPHLSPQPTLNSLQSWWNLVIPFSISAQRSTSSKIQQLMQGDHTDTSQHQDDSHQSHTDSSNPHTIQSYLSSLYLHLAPVDPIPFSPTGYSVQLLSPYISHDISGILNQLTQSRQFLHPVVSTLFLKDITKSLSLLHAQFYLHRDLKSANILVNTQGQVFLGDFGLSRPIPMLNYHFLGLTPRTVTLYYRPPEMLFGFYTREYGNSIDIWSLGCVFSELLHNLHLFGHCGSVKTETQLLLSMLNTLGPFWHPSHAEQYVHNVNKPNGKIIYPCLPSSSSSSSRVREWIDPLELDAIGVEDELRQSSKHRQQLNPALDSSAGGDDRIIIPGRPSSKPIYTYGSPNDPIHQGERVLLFRQLNRLFAKDRTDPLLYDYFSNFVQTSKALAQQSIVQQIQQHQAQQQQQQQQLAPQQSIPPLDSPEYDAIAQERQVQYWERFNKLMSTFVLQHDHNPQHWTLFEGLYHLYSGSLDDLLDIKGFPWHNPSDTSLATGVVSTTSDQGKDAMSKTSAISLSGSDPADKTLSSPPPSPIPTANGLSPSDVMGDVSPLPQLQPTDIAPTGDEKPSNTTHVESLPAMKSTGESTTTTAGKAPRDAQSQSRQDMLIAPGAKDTPEKKALLEKNHLDIYATSVPLALPQMDFLSWALSARPEARPSALQLLLHPLFQSRTVMRHQHQINTSTSNLFAFLSADVDMHEGRAKKKP